MSGCCGGNTPIPAKSAERNGGCCGEAEQKPAETSGSCCGGAERKPAETSDGCCGGVERNAAETSGGCCGGAKRKPAETSDGCCGGAERKPAKTSDGCCGGAERNAAGAEADCCGSRGAVVIRSTTSQLTAADRWDHVLARWGFRRGEHRVAPGLYALGNPTPDSPVFVTANYTLSFDALRSSLPGMDGYILVLDTKGINVWCAAGKGTFGTDELVRRIEAADLKRIIRHRNLILPQLGAPGVAAHEVKKQSGFKVEYGPVRASDLPAYLQTHAANPGMRRVQFNLADRIVLIPIELVATMLPMLAAAVVAFLLGGWIAAFATALAFLAGVVLFPILFPFLPAKDFSVKGWILGLAAMLPVGWLAWAQAADSSWWVRAGSGLALLLILPPVTAFLSLNFTGSTPYPSRTGVKREIFAYILPMAVSLTAGVLLAIAAPVIKFAGRM